MGLAGMELGRQDRGDGPSVAREAAKDSQVGRGRFCNFTSRRVTDFLQFVAVTVIYSTTTQCTAIGWLDPVQTKSGKYPYLYSQAQAIHARSMLPCQDTPAIKATYSAKVKGVLPVLMSGLRQSPPPEEKWVPGKEVEYVYDQVRQVDDPVGDRSLIVEPACRHTLISDRHRIWRARVQAFQAA
jgi:hypothetical protein